MFAQTFCHIKKQDFKNPASVNYFDAQSNASIGAQYNAMNGGRQEAKRKEMLAQTGRRGGGGLAEKGWGRVRRLQNWWRIEVGWRQTSEIGLESSLALRLFGVSGPAISIDVCTALLKLPLLEPWFIRVYAGGFKSVRVLLLVVACYRWEF